MLILISTDPQKCSNKHQKPSETVENPQKHLKIVKHINNHKKPANYKQICSTPTKPSRSASRITHGMSVQVSRF